MYTLRSPDYMEKAVFRQDTFYLILKDKVGLDDAGMGVPRIFHWCPELAKLQADNVGIVFLSEDVTDMQCDRCRKSPGDDIITVYTMLVES